MSVTSSSVIRSDISIKRARPRTGDGSGTDGEVDAVGVSRMHTAALLALPDPRRIAVRPVSWIVVIIVEGGVVDVVVNICLGREKSISCKPGSVDKALDMSLMQASQCMGTEKVAW